MVFYKNLTIFNLCQKKNYIILNFNYPMVNIFLVIFLNKKVGFILNSNRKVSLSILPTTFLTTKKKKKHIQQRTEFDYKLVYCQLATTHYVAINKIIHVYFSRMTYLISHMTSLNNTCRWSYKLLHGGL